MGGGVFLSNIVNPTKAVLHYVCHQKLAFSKFREWTFSLKLVYGASSEATPSAFSCTAAVAEERNVKWIVRMIGFDWDVFISRVVARSSCCCDVNETLDGFILNPLETISIKRQKESCQLWIARLGFSVGVQQQLDVATAYTRSFSRWTELSGTHEVRSKWRPV